MTNSEKYWNDNHALDYLKTKPPAPDVISYFKNVAPGVILDLGCGTGRHSVWLAQNNFIVTGCDKHSSMVKETSDLLNKAKLNGKVQKGDMLDLPFQDSIFEFILSVGVLHNAESIKDFNLALSEVARTLRPGGRFFFTVFTNDRVSSELIEIEPNLYLTKDNIHMVLLSRDQIKLLAQDNRLLVDEEIRLYETKVQTGLRSVWSVVLKRI